MNSNQAVLDLDHLPELFPHAVARASELVSLGLSGGKISSRCRPNGPWQRLQPDLVLLSDSPPTRLQRLKAAWRVTGPHAVVTGREAMWLNGMPVTPCGAVHLAVPGSAATRADGSVLAERTTWMPDPLWRRGFPAAPLARATVDACRRTPTVEEVRFLLGEATSRGGVALGELHDEVGRLPARGATLLRRVLGEIDRGIRTAGARTAAELVRRAGLPPPRWTTRLTTADDVHLAVVDAWWDDIGLAWDADIHRPWSPRAGLSTMTRSARLTAAGVAFLHTNPDRVLDDPVSVMAELRTAHRLASARPRPPVVAS